MTYHVEMLPFLFAAALRIMIAIYAWTRRDVPVARTFGWMMAAGALWTSVYILHLADPTLEGKLFWQKIMYLGAAFTPALWLIVAIQITGHKNWLTRPVRLAIFTWPIIVILSAFTNDWHHLFWTDYQLDDYKIEWNATHGPLFQVFQVPAFLLLLFNLILFTHHFFTCPRFYRPQAILLLIGGSLPVTSRIVQVVFGVELLDKVDQVPLWLSVSGILYVIAIFRY
ncbi:MAG: histidine kinase N-terminal 7TM domain-containing protein, partial [Pseudomonadota bacterium]